MVRTRPDGDEAQPDGVRQRTPPCSRLFEGVEICFANKNVCFNRIFKCACDSVYASPVLPVHRTGHALQSAGLFSPWDSRHPKAHSEPPKPKERNEMTHDRSRSHLERKRKKKKEKKPPPEKKPPNGRSRALASNFHHVF